MVDGFVGRETVEVSALCARAKAEHKLPALPMYVRPMAGPRTMFRDCYNLDFDAGPDGRFGLLLSVIQGVAHLRQLEVSYQFHKARAAIVRKLASDRLKSLGLPPLAS